MAIREILIDTNAYAAFKRNAPEAVETNRRVLLIVVNSIVLGELLSGFAVGSREPDNKHELQLFLSSQRVKQVSVNNSTAEYYATVYKELRKKGHPIPTNDMWIAASAFQHNLAVFTYDNHFQAVDGLIAGNQLSDFIF